jgi:hypothetical protein
LLLDSHFVIGEFIVIATIGMLIFVAVIVGFAGTSHIVEMMVANMLVDIKSVENMTEFLVADCIRVAVFVGLAYSML